MGRIWQIKIPSDNGDLIEPGWDEPINQVLDLQMRKLFILMLALKNINFPRCLHPENTTGNPWLLMYSDSSMIAYGTVAYIRWKLKTGGYWIRLIASKNRMWPIASDDYLSVARGELNGCVLSKRLSEFI